MTLRHDGHQLRTHAVCAPLGLDVIVRGHLLAHKTSEVRSTTNLGWSRWTGWSGADLEMDRLCGSVDYRLYPGFLSLLHRERERADKRHLCATDGVGTGNRAGPQPSHDSCDAASALLRKLNLGIEVANPS